MADKIHILRGSFRLDAVRDSPGDGAKIFPMRLATVGVRSYFYEDSNWNVYEVREALLPSELFRKETMETAKGAIITHYHPWRMLDGSNWDLYAKGVTVGEPYIEDNKFLCIDVKVFDETLQAYMLSGINDGCSVGFRQTFVEEPGEINGEKYDGYNSMVEINHIAICARDDARGGEELGVKLDTRDVALDTAFRLDTKTYGEYKQLRKDSKPKIGGKKMKTIRLDGKDFEVADEVALRLDSLVSSEKAARERLDTLEGENKALTEEKEKVTARADQAEVNLANTAKEKEELQARLDAMPTEEEIVKNVELAGFVGKYTGESVDYKMDSKELRLKALGKAFPEEKFDTRTDAYIEARMDMLKDTLEKDGFPVVERFDTDLQGKKEERVDSFVDETGRGSNHFSKK